MKESRYVYGWLALLAFAFIALSAFAGPRVIVPQLPTPERPLAEVETNVVFSTLHGNGYGQQMDADD